MKSTKPLRVLHVTEAMSTGVLTFIDSITRGQAGEGAHVSVLYTARAETPSRDRIEARFSPQVGLLSAIDHGSSTRNLFALWSRLWRLSRSGEYDVIHLHSSVAGGVGRLAAHGGRSTLFYSPHGFAFLRENSSRLSRWAALIAERRLARRAVLILTSASEMELGRQELGAPRTAFLQSGIPSASMTSNDARGSASRLRVVMVGRIAYQKAPWRFAAVAKELSALADFVWVGGGEEDDRTRWFGDSPVDIREWVTPGELDQILATSDVLLFPTLWEGMSLSLIQAQSWGLPAVTTDVVGNRDTVIDGTTGFVCTDDAGLIAATRRLLLDPELRRRMGADAKRRIRDYFTDDHIGRDSISLYLASVPRETAATTTGSERGTR